MASLTTSKKSLPIHEIDTNMLFEKHTIEEIREIEKKTRVDIERKKEDLRTMVGERYRDLIEAADTITDMKTSAQNVMNSISKIEVLCKKLHQNHMVHGTSFHERPKSEIDTRRKKELKFHGVSSQIKLLLDMPEKIWSCLDAQDYLTATRHYLLARHIHTGLQLDAQQSHDLLSWFPVLTRQWAAISHFRATILQGCRSLLKEADVADEKIADSLCSLILLEDTTPRQVFNEFLLARTTAVQQLFHSTQQSSSVKDQICTVVQLITTTVHQIHSVFYQGDQVEKSDLKVASNLLVIKLTEVTSKKQHETGLLDFHHSLKGLPLCVVDFCPTLRSHASPVSLQHLQDNCRQWVDTCIRDVKHGIGKLLGFVNTIKRIADIRDTVWDQLSHDSSLASWEQVCEHVLDRKLSVWKDFLWSLFLDRVKALIKYHLDSATELTKRQVSKVVMEIGSTEDGTGTAVEVDLSRYIWKESSGDILTNMAWMTAASRKGTQNPGGLLMKAKAYTPVTQSLCRSYDEKLSSLLEDLNHYLLTFVENDTSEKGPFDRHSDTSSLLDQLKEKSKLCVEELLVYLEEQLELWKVSLAEIPDKVTNLVTTNKILLVGRFCGALVELAPALKQSVIGKTTDEKREDKGLKKISTRGQNKVAEDPLWIQTKERLAHCHKISYRLWVNYFTSVLLKDFKASIGGVQGKDCIKNCTKWDEVNIQEETEDGKSVKSVIRVPMQASWYVQTLNFALCKEINRIGGHTIQRKVLEDLVTKVSDGVMSCYEDLIASSRKRKSNPSSPLSQQLALQFLFDVKFLSSVMPRKEDVPENKIYQQRVARIVEGLEEKIDPFDLDVFQPYVQSHLNKQSQRTMILYGAVTSLDRLGLYGGSRSQSGVQQEQHNILPLTSCSNRFTLLPLSTQPSYSSLPQPVVQPPIQRSTTSLTEKAAAVLPQPSPGRDMTSSFYNRISSVSSMSDFSSWFSNIGGSK